MKNKLLCLLLAISLLFGLLAGCARAKNSASQPESDTAVSESASDEPIMEPDDTTVPADTDPTDEAVTSLPADYPRLCEEGEMQISAFIGLNLNLAEHVTDYSEVYFWQEVTKRTGVTFEWEMVSIATVQEQFNLLCAASALPSLVCEARYWTDSTAAAIEEDVFIDLAPYLQEYAPDYYALATQDACRGIFFDENGSTTCFYQIGMEEFPPNCGMVLRADLLEEQNLELPVTYNEYKETLAALKNAYNMEAPLFLFSSTSEDYAWLSGGYNVKKGMSLSPDGEVIYGPMEDGFRDFLRVFNDWYESGLIYKDFYNVPAGQEFGYSMNYLSTGKTAVTYTYCDLVGMIQMADPNDRLVGSVLPRVDHDDEVHLTGGVDSQYSTGVGYAISTNATDEEIPYICMLLNYFFTDEGALLCNYGVEGETFEYNDEGKPWYTDCILNNPDGLTVIQAQCMYLGYIMPCYSDFTKYNITAVSTWKELVDVWKTADNTYAIPSIALTTAETEQYNKAYSDVSTYLDECLVKFMIGDLDIDDDEIWNEYLNTMRDLGVQDMIDAYTTAMVRYRAI